jgi:uncharacterized protein (UPF0332 family)
MKEPRDFLEKAAESMDAADLLLENGYVNIAASRTYYGCFYTAQALLFSLGLEYSSHRQVVAQYGRHFSKTRLLDPSYHALLLTAFDLRQFADYQVENPVKAEVVSDLIAGGRSFLKAASDYLANLPEPPSGGDAEP